MLQALYEEIVIVICNSHNIIKEWVCKYLHNIYAEIIKMEFVNNQNSRWAAAYRQYTFNETTLYIVEIHSHSIMDNYEAQ